MRLALLLALCTGSLASLASAAAPTSFLGTSSTVTSCKTEYGSKSVTPPLLTLSTSLATPSYSRSTTTSVFTKTVTPTPRSTVVISATVTNTLIVAATRTVTRTTTFISTTSSPTTTITVPTSSGFKPLVPLATSKVSARSWVSNEKRATTISSDTKTIPTAVACTTQMVFVSVFMATSITTKTLGPLTTTRTKTLTRTQYAATVTATKTTTKAMQPTQYAQCADNNLASVVRTGDGQLHPINSARGNDDIFWISGVTGPGSANLTARECCVRCAQNGLCIGSAWTWDVAKYTPYPYHFRCTLYLTLLECPFERYPLPYGYDSGVASKAGDVVLSNGGCGGWTKQ